MILQMTYYAKHWWFFPRTIHGMIIPILIFPGYDVNEAVKSLIPTSPKRRTSSLSERKSSQTDFKKIQKLRQEYGSAAMQRIPEGLGDNKENEGDGDRRNSVDSGVNSMADGGLERKLGSLKVGMDRLEWRLSPDSHCSLQSWYPTYVIKSLQFIWRLCTRRFHLLVPNLQMSCSDLT